MKQVPITRCQYCGSEDISIGWQCSNVLVTFKKHSLLLETACNIRYAAAAERYCIRVWQSHGDTQLNNNMQNAKKVTGIRQSLYL